LACLILLPPALARAEGDPQAVVQTFCDRLLAVMQHAQDLGFKGREDKLRPAIGEAYDIPKMARNALGPSSAKLSPEELSQLTASFEHYTVATYAAQFDGYGGETFQVDAPKPSVDGTMVVPSRIVPKSGEPTEIDYLLRQDPALGWRIVDVLLDGSVSQVAVRRSEFVSIYRRDGLNGLVRVLDEKSKAMGEQ